jgi:hypothetical protein
MGTGEHPVEFTSDLDPLLFFRHSQRRRSDGKIARATALTDPSSG